MHSPTAEADRSLSSIDNDPASQPAIVCARHLTKSFRRGTESIAVVARADIAVAAGEWVAIVGRSGSGKSTLLQMLGGLITPSSGDVAIAGHSLIGRSESARAVLRRRQVGYVFQRYNLIDELSVVDNVSLPLRLLGTSRRQARIRARHALTELGLGGDLDRAPCHLSGGEQQRAAIARALIARPAVVLADEPTGALDSRSADTVINCFVHARQAGQAIVMVTHDPSVAAVADRVLEMVDGTLRLQAS